MDAAQRKALKHPNKLGAGAKARKHLRGAKKAEVIMHEFKRGTLHSGSGEIVTNPAQAKAIMMSSAYPEKHKRYTAQQKFETHRMKQGAKHH